MNDLRTWLKAHPFIAFILIPAIFGGTLGGLGSVMFGLISLIVTCPLSGFIAHQYAGWISEEE